MGVRHMGSSDDDALAATTYPPPQTISGVEATVAAPAVSSTGVAPISGIEATIAPPISGLDPTVAPISGIEATLAGSVSGVEATVGAPLARTDHTELVGVER